METDAEGLSCTDEECDDLQFCNGLEECTSDGCVPGVAPTLDDGFDCTLDTCDEDLDLIVHTARDELCNDDVECTLDRCDEESGCVATPLDRDGDGFADADCPGGSDCDDTDPFVNPDATEACGNLADDDCDSDVDFDDADCPAGDRCATVIPLPRVGTYHGSFRDEDDSSHESGSCGGAGPERVYSLTLTERSSLHTSALSEDLELAIYVRSSECGDEDAERICDATGERIPLGRVDLMDISPGEYFIFVDTMTWWRETGDFVLTVDWAPVGCGNGFLEPSEECDDGNLDDGDTCSASCLTTGEHLLVFDGDDDSLMVPDDPDLDLTDNFTVELWFRVDPLTTGRRWPLLRKGYNTPNYAIWVWDDGTLLAGIYQDTAPQIVTSGEDVGDGSWHHTALVYSRRRLELFLDGERVDTESIGSHPPNTNSTSLMIGAGVASDGVHWYPGAIDEVRISSTRRYRSDGDPELPPRRFTADASTLLLLHFDEGSGRYARDSSTSAFLGLVNGCTWEEEE